MKFISKFNQFEKIALILIAAVVAFSACTHTPVVVHEQETAVMETAAANLTATALLAPPTEIPTEIPAAVEMTPTVRVLPTQLRYGEPTVASIPTAANVVSTVGVVGNKAELISTAPNNNQTARYNQTFTLTFTLKNVGSSIWTNQYKAIHTGGTKMSVTDSAPMSGNVGNGMSGTITFSMVAPKDKGTYTQNFNFIDPWNAVILPLTFTVIVSDQGNIPQANTLTPTIAPTRTGTQMSHFEYMCSDEQRSIQQGEGCDTFCLVTQPYRNPCYIRGVLNPTATAKPADTATPVPTQTTAPTATPNAAQTSEAATQAAQQEAEATAAAQTAEAFAATQTAQAAEAGADDTGGESSESGGDSGSTEP